MDVHDMELIRVASHLVQVDTFIRIQRPIYRCHCFLRILLLGEEEAV
jgi:hypothetical protein